MSNFETIIRLSPVNGSDKLFPVSRMADSVIIFDVSAVKLKKYGNAIHRDTDIVYF